MNEMTTSFLRTLMPDEVRPICGIPVRRVGLLWFELDADSACAQGLLTLDEAEYALGYMTTLPRVTLPVSPAIVSLVGKVATALLLGRTLTVTGPRSSCTVGPVLDADGAGVGWACVGFDGDVVPTIESWDVCDEYGYAHPFVQPDPSPFGVARAFVQLVGGAQASAALPGTVVQWFCQAAVDHGHPAEALPVDGPVVVEDGPFCEWGLCLAPLAGPAREGCGSPYQHADGYGAPAGQEGETVAHLQLEERVAAEATPEDMEPAAPVQIAWSVATAERGDAVHVVVGARVEVGRWAREPGQALCKPRGLRLKSASGQPSCKGCLAEAEKRNIALT